MSSLPRHPFGIRYCLLWLGAWLVRLPAFAGTYFTLPKAFRELRSDVTRTRIQIPSREKTRKITVDVYERADRAEGTKKPVHINFHGSGFILPSLGSDLDFCAQLAATTGTVVLDADYRKAPESPFPAAYQDAEDVLGYVQSHTADFDASRLTVGGFSAGANLAMSVAVNSPNGPVAAIVSIYGNPDMTKVYPAPDKSYDGGMVLPEWLRSFFYRCLVLPGQGKDDMRLSPAYASLDRWPKHVFFACGAADSLHDAGKVMVKRLSESGHDDVDFMSVEHEAHAFDKVVRKGSPTEKKRREMYQRAIDTIQRAQESAQKL